MRKSLVAAAITAVAVGGSFGVALAADSGAAATRVYTACTHDFKIVDLFAGGQSCPKGDGVNTWNQTGPAGPQGKTGPAGPGGPAGPQGPSGVIASTTTDLGGVASVPTGGSFVTNSTQVGGTIALRAGTYLVSVNAKATPNVSAAIEVFPEFFVYNQVRNAGFTGDLFNVGSGPLASNNTNIDSYYSGSTTLTLTADTTLRVYAFGYDSDRSASTYTLDGLTVTATQINAG